MCPLDLTIVMMSNKISDHVWSKRHFDPNSKDDLLQYKYFLDHNKWQKNCPFTLEWPYLNVQEMIRNKIIDSHFNKILESVK